MHRAMTNNQNIDREREKKKKTNSNPKMPSRIGSWISATIATITHYLDDDDDEIKGCYRKGILAERGPTGVWHSYAFLDY